jgi:Uncharacterized ACR, COG1993
MKCRAQFLLSQNTQHAALREISGEEAMHIPKDAMLLRIFIGENDRFEQQSLSEALVLKAREMHLAGATVLRGPMGYGHSSRLHTAKILRLHLTSRWWSRSLTQKPRSMSSCLCWIK